MIVLLILAGTAISIAINGGDIFGKANQARLSWNDSVAEEQAKVDDVLTILNSIAIDGTQQITENLISKDTSINDGNGYVGYYADFDGVPGVDGIIYADLLVQKPASGQWVNSNGAYTIPTNVNASNVKDYVISETPVTDARFENSISDPSTYTPRYVISPASSSTGTEARFYVMGLDNLTDGTNDTLYWYRSAYNSYNYEYDGLGIITSKEFGAGKTNTDLMLAEWDPAGDETTQGTYGNRNSRDMWKWVKAKRNEYAGWYIPSAGEWAAFGNSLNVTSTPWAYQDLGFKSDFYWSSSQRKIESRYWSGSWVISFSQTSTMTSASISGACYVRLGATI